MADSTFTSRGCTSNLNLNRSFTGLPALEGCERYGLISLVEDSQWNRIKHLEFWTCTWNAVEGSMRGLNFFYRDPKSWLVRLNLVVSFVALVPIVIEISLWALTASRVRLGEAGMMLIGVPLIILWAIGQIGYVVCVPGVLAASALLFVPDIPRKVRLITAALSVASCIVLVLEVGRLRTQLNHGTLGSP
jgi:hypothetical protein